jgi:hypothetical protein
VPCCLANRESPITLQYPALSKGKCRAQALHSFVRKPHKAPAFPTTVCAEPVIHSVAEDSQKANQKCEEGFAAVSNAIAAQRPVPPQLIRGARAVPRNPGGRRQKLLDNATRTIHSSERTACLRDHNDAALPRLSRTWLFQRQSQGPEARAWEFREATG